MEFLNTGIHRGARFPVESAIFNLFCLNDDGVFIAVSNRYINFVDVDSRAVLGFSSLVYLIYDEICQSKQNFL